MYIVQYTRVYTSPTRTHIRTRVRTRVLTVVGHCYQRIVFSMIVDDDSRCWRLDMQATGQVVVVQWLRDVMAGRRRHQLHLGGKTALSPLDQRDPLVICYT